jgi:signal peptidase I
MAMSDPAPRPSVENLDRFLEGQKRKKAFHRALMDTLKALVVVAAVAVLISTLWLPVIRVYGDSMDPTLTAGDIVLAVKAGDYQRGDILAFYFNNRILLKRVVALGGETIALDENGAVSINGAALDEPYATLDMGACDIQMPYLVPEGRLFVMGDARAVSIDSRSTVVGPVGEEQILGKVALRVWPLGRAGRDFFPGS